MDANNLLLNEILICAGSSLALLLWSRQRRVWKVLLCTSFAVILVWDSLAMFGFLFYEPDEQHGRIIEGLAYVGESSKGSRTWACPGSRWMPS